MQDGPVTINSELAVTENPLPSPAEHSPYRPPSLEADTYGGSPHLMLHEALALLLSHAEEARGLQNWFQQGDIFALGPSRLLQALKTLAYELRRLLCCHLSGRFLLCFLPLFRLVCALARFPSLSLCRLKRILVARIHSAILVPMHRP